MERDICIGGVEFSNPARTFTYMRDIGNACSGGPGVAPCACESTACDPVPLFTLSVPTLGEGDWAGLISSEVDGLTIVASHYRLVGAYEVGTGGPCDLPDPATIPALGVPGWTGGAVSTPVDDTPLTYVVDPTPGEVAACKLVRLELAVDGDTIGVLYVLQDLGDDTLGPRAVWIPTTGTRSPATGWRALVDGPYEYGVRGPVIPCGEEPAPLYTDPVTDDAPWYDPEDPRSADMLGVWVDDLVLSSPLDRTASNRQWGGTLSATKFGRRELTIGGRIYVRSKAAAEYARQWAFEALMNSPCGEAGCRLPTVELLAYCDTEDPDRGLRYLHEVGLIDWQWNLDTTDPLHCFAQFSATLAAKIPWLTKVPETVHTGLVLASSPFCDVCGNMTDAGECDERVIADPLALQCGCTDQPARAIPTSQRAECYVRPMYVARQYIPVTNPKLWTDGALRFTIRGGTEGIASTVPSVKNLRIRAYANPLGLGPEDGNTLLCGSDPCADVAIGCVPYGATMVIDGSTRRATVSVANQARSANPYLSSGSGKFTYPEYSCGDLMLAIDTDALQTSADSTIEIETIEVERG